MKQKIPYGVQKDFSVFKETMVEMTWQEVHDNRGKSGYGF